MRGYYLGKALNKYYTKKYGKNFERAPKKYNVIYAIHYLFCILLLVAVQAMTTPMELILLFATEFMLFIAFAMHPSYTTVVGMILPIIGLTINISTWGIMTKMYNTIELTETMTYTCNMITVITNLVVNTFLMIKLFLENQTTSLVLTVKEKVQADDEYTVVLFDDNNGTQYFTTTSLSEKFIENQTYQINIRKADIGRKPVYMKEKNHYEIKNINEDSFYIS